MECLGCTVLVQHRLPPTSRLMTANSKKESGYLSFYEVDHLTIRLIKGGLRQYKSTCALPILPRFSKTSQELRMLSSVTLKGIVHQEKLLKWSKWPTNVRIVNLGCKL